MTFVRFVYIFTIIGENQDGQAWEGSKKYYKISVTSDMNGFAQYF